MDQQPPINQPPIQSVESTKKYKYLIPSIITGLVLVAGVCVGAYFYNKDTISRRSFISQASPQINDTKIEDAPSQILNNQNTTEINMRILFNNRKGDPETNTNFISNPDGQNKKEVLIGCKRVDNASGEDFRCNGSKDGFYLARWNNKNIQIAPSKDLSSFRTIVEIKNSDENINQLIWSDDSSNIIYETYKYAGPSDGPYQPTENKIMMIARDGTQSSTLKQSRDLNASLQGLNLKKNELYWLETGEGGSFNFTVFDLNSKTVKEVDKNLSIESEYVFSSDFSKIYYVDVDKSYSNRIEVYDLISKTKKTLYENKNIGQDKHGNKSQILGLSISPDNNLMAFSVYNEPSDKEISYSLKLPNEQIKTLLDDSRYYNLAPKGFSPDGKYLWFETKCWGCGVESGFDNRGEYYIMNMDTKEIKLFFKSKTDKSKIPAYRLNESIDFLSWLIN